jgi:hypothetical protein
MQGEEGLENKLRKEWPSKGWMAFMGEYYIASVRGLSFLLTAKDFAPKIRPSQLP